MKNSLMNLHDKIMLRKGAVIETVNDELKNVCQIEHPRHRSIDNFASNLFAGLIAYNLQPKKPQMNVEIIEKQHHCIILIPKSRFDYLFTTASQRPTRPPKPF